MYKHKHLRNFETLHVVTKRQARTLALHSNIFSEYNRKVRFFHSQLFISHLPSYQGSDLTSSEVRTPSPICTMSHFSTGTN
jgi:hypothetical protein